MNPFLFFLSSHLKLRSLRQLSLSKGDRGFVLPLVIMIGLVLVVASLGIVASSHNSQKNTIAQKSTAEGLAIAETGVTRILDLINQNRYISMFPDCVSRNSSTGACNDASTSPVPKSWATITSFPSATVCGTAGSPSDVQAVASTQSWVNVNGSNTQYRLINYQYSPTVGVAPGNASLTIEGRVNNGSPSNSTSRLEVKIPVEPGPLLTEGIPGVWLAKGSTGNNNKIQGDTLINDCTVTQAQLDAMNTNTIIGNDPITGQAYEAKYTAMTFPDLPTKPSPFLNTLDLPNNTSGIITLPCLTTPCNYSTTPTVADRANASGVYEYSANNIKLQTGSSKLIITPGQKVTIYLDGEIDGNTEMVHNCTGVSGCKPTNFQIYGYAVKTTIPNFTPQICLIGNNELEAFIYAKEYTVGVGGTGVVRGTIWADAWSTSGGCGSNTSNIVVEQSARWTDLGLQPKNTPPILRNIASWQRKQR